MTDIAIRVQNLSKRYQIYDSRVTGSSSLSSPNCAVPYRL